LPKNLVEAVHHRQELVLVAEMVLAELSGGVAERLQKFGNGRIFFRLQADVRARLPDLRQPRSNRVLPGDERCTTGGAGVTVSYGDMLVR
jgi:hypothetical protein